MLMKLGKVDVYDTTTHDNFSGCTATWVVGANSSLSHGGSFLPGKTLLLYLDCVPVLVVLSCVEVC